MIRRGEIVSQNGEITAKPGSGEFLARNAGDAAKPSGRRQPEFDQKLNFGVDLG